MSTEIPIVRRGEPSEGFVQMTELVASVMARQTAEDAPRSTIERPSGATILRGRMRAGKHEVSVFRTAPGTRGALQLSISSLKSKAPFIFSLWANEAKRLVRLLDLDEARP